MSTVQVQPFQLAYQNEPTRIVRGRITKPSGSDERLPAVLVVHGFKGFLEWGFFPELQVRLAQAGLVSIAFNLSGSGVGEDLQSFTEDDAFYHSTPSRDVEDLECVRTFLESSNIPYVDLSRLALLGHSRGGGTALLHAERTESYGAVVTWASVAGTLRFPKEALEAWRRDGVVEIPNARTGKIHRIGTGWLDDAEAHADALDIPAACSRLKTPALLVHGTADESVPIGDAELLENALQPERGRLLRIEGAGHTFDAVHPFAGPTPALETALGASIDFLHEHLK